jgi:hypothetical protein
MGAVNDRVRGEFTLFAVGWRVAAALLTLNRHRHGANAIINGDRRARSSPLITDISGEAVRLIGEIANRT